VSLIPGVGVLSGVDDGLDLVGPDFGDLSSHPAGVSIVRGDFTNRPWPLGRRIDGITDGIVIIIPHDPAGEGFPVDSDGPFYPRRPASDLLITASAQETQKDQDQ